ncbi:MAG: ABC transporter permease [Acidobacteria bacterium]|jgi:putative ABC transport system permease protein|nr:ABC transporter permease [Acidobacteriota bacterium]
MVIGEALRTTLTEVWAHKLRSSLTLVGVVLGTVAVVTMVSLIEAVKVEVWNGVATLGYDGVMFVSSAGPKTPLDRARAHLSEGLQRNEATHLADGTNLVDAAAPVAFSQQVLAWGGVQKVVRLYGITPVYARVLNRSVDRGRYITPIDVEGRRRVIVIGHDLAEEIFGGDDPVGKTVRVGSHGFQVVGVGSRIGNGFVQDGWGRREMRGALVPLTTFQGLFTGNEKVPLVVVKTRDTSRLGEVFAFLKNRLWRRHNRVEDFEVDNVAAEILEAENQIDKQMRGWTVVLFAISAISLVVGGVGIFSVLQISLAERLYEIGLRKGIGAQDRDILVQFMIEAVFLSALGAAIGLVLSVGLCTALGPKFEAGLPISGFAVLLAVVFAVGVGVTAGLYPSLKAARLTPVEALRG